MKALRRVALALGAVGGLLCTGAAPPPVKATPGYDDVAEKAGIAFTHDAAPPVFHVTQTLGPGCAWGDFDNDGWVDLYVTNMGPPPNRKASGVTGGRLYRNKKDGTFEDVTEKAGVSSTGQKLGASWADVDGDGFPELLVSGYGGVSFYRNQRNGTFKDATKESGLASLDGKFCIQGIWGDYDRDGKLDLYELTYVNFTYPAEETMPRVTDWKGKQVPAPLAIPLFDGTPHVLFRNQGDGTFQDVTEKAGVADNDDKLGKSLGGIWTDVNNDGWMDIVIANDGVRKTVFVNQKDGTFKSSATKMWITDFYGSMGVATADVDGDGYLDIHFTNWFREPNTLYVSKRGVFFNETSERAGLASVTMPMVCWGAEFTDHDNDGVVDILVASGSTFAAKYDWANYMKGPNLLEPMPMHLWRGGGQGDFEDASAAAGVDRFVTNGRAVAIADYDHDGYEDAAVGVNNGRPLLLHNRGGTKNHWLTVTLTGKKSNRSGIGARVVINVCGRKQTRELAAGSSYLSQTAPEVHFGLGAMAEVDSVEVRWPSGEVSKLANVKADQRLNIAE